MSDRAPWSDAADITRQLDQLWSRGEILRAMLDEQALFPLALRLRRPDPRALAERFDEVRQWIKTLSDESKESRGFGYDLQWAEVNHRQLGRNRMPVGAVVETEADALKLIGKKRDADSFRELSQATLSRFPELKPWLVRRPLSALEHARDWTKILELIAWFRRNPRARLYMRQIDLPGIDTKFVEARRGLIGELLDAVLPTENVDVRFAGAKGFEQRYGLRTKPCLVRLRFLDERLALNGITDITVRTDELARLRRPVWRVFVTENEINGLTFPNLPGAVVVFGLGYGVNSLAEIEWLREVPIHYWGDIDTHGFVMLDRLRATFARVQSLLMDRETLLAHRELWVKEDNPVSIPLPHLTAPEAALYDELTRNTIGQRVRLEQERISFGWLERALKSDPISSPIVT